MRRQVPQPKKTSSSSANPNRSATSQIAQRLVHEIFSAENDDSTRWGYADAYALMLAQISVGYSPMSTVPPTDKQQREVANMMHNRRVNLETILDEYHGGRTSPRQLAVDAVRDQQSARRMFETITVATATDDDVLSSSSSSPPPAALAREIETDASWMRTASDAFGVLRRFGFYTVTTLVPWFGMYVGNMVLQAVVQKQLMDWGLMYRPNIDARSVNTHIYGVQGDIRFDKDKSGSFSSFEANEAA